MSVKLNIDLETLFKVKQVQVVESLDGQGLKDALKQLLDLVGSLVNKVDKIPSDLAEKLGAIDRIPTDLDARLGSLDKIPSDLSDQLNALRKGVDAAKEDADKAKADAAKATSRIEDLNDKIANCVTRPEFDAKSAALQDGLDAAKGRAAAVEAQLVDVKKALGETSLKASDALAKGARAEERNAAQDAELAAMRAAIEALSRGEAPAPLPPAAAPAPVVDLGPVERRLEKLANDTADLDSLRDRIRELEAQLAAQSRKLGDLPTAVAGGPSAAELKDLYDQMNAKASRDEVAKKAAQFDLDKLQNRLADLEDRVGNKADRADVDAALAALTAHDDTEPMTVTAGGDVSEEIAGALNGQAAKLKSLEGLLALLQTKVDGKASLSDLDALRAELKRLREDLDRAEKDLGDKADKLSTDLGALEGKFGAVGQALAALAAKAKKLEDDGLRLDATDRQQQAQIGDLGARKADKSDLDALRAAIANLGPVEVSGGSDLPADAAAKLAALEKDLQDMRHHVLTVAYGLLITSVGDKAAKIVPHFRHDQPVGMRGGGGGSASNDQLGSAVNAALDAAKEGAGMKTGPTEYAPASALTPAPAARGLGGRPGSQAIEAAGSTRSMGEPSGDAYGNANANTVSDVGEAPSGPASRQESLRAPAQAPAPAQAQTQAQASASAPAQAPAQAQAPALAPAQAQAPPPPSAFIGAGPSFAVLPTVGSGQNLTGLGNAGGHGAGAAGSGSFAGAGVPASASHMHAAPAAAGAAASGGAAGSGITLQPFASVQTEETIIGPGFTSNRNKAPAVTVTSAGRPPVVPPPAPIPPRAQTPVDALRDMLGKGDLHEKADKDALKKLAKFLDDNVQFRSVPGTPGDGTPNMLVGGDPRGLTDMVRRLQLEIERLKKRVGQMGVPNLTQRTPDGDYAMLSSKPLFGYRCMSCDRPLDKLENQPGYYIPHELFPPSSRATDPSVASPPKSPLRSGANSPGPRDTSPAPRRPVSGPGSSAAASQRPGITPQKGWFNDAHGPPLIERPSDAGPHLPPGGWRGNAEQGSRPVLIGSASKSTLQAQGGAMDGGAEGETEKLPPISRG